MANVFQLKRTTVSGRTPNTTNAANTSFIDVGELAINIPDKKLFSSNGSVLFEIGANLTSSAIGTLTVGSIVAPFETPSNTASAGSNDYFLSSNGTNTFWKSMPTAVGVPIYYANGSLVIGAVTAVIATSIDDLADVDTTTTAPANSDVLTWSNTVQNWVPTAKPVGVPIYYANGVLIANSVAAVIANSIDDLSDVDTTSAAPGNNNLLAWANATQNWVPVSEITVANITVGTTTVNTTVVAVGSNVVLSTSSLSVGNSTVNSSITSTAVNTTAVGVGSNVVLSTSSLSIGNSTVNSSVTSTTISTRNRLTLNGVAGNTYIDTSSSDTSYANGATVHFPNFSGLLVVNNTGTTGQIELVICGGGSVGSLGFSGTGTPHKTGTVVANATINGYTWINDSGATDTFSFAAIRTRTTA